MTDVVEVIHVSQPYPKISKKKKNYNNIRKYNIIPRWSIITLVSGGAENHRQTNMDRPASVCVCWCVGVGVIRVSYLIAVRPSYCFRVNN